MATSVIPSVVNSFGAHPKCLHVRDGSWLDSTRPDLSVLLTCGKKEANLSLTWVLYDPTQRDFFDPKGKNLKIGTLSGNFPNPNQRWTLPGSKFVDPNPSLLHF